MPVIHNGGSAKGPSFFDDFFRAATYNIYNSFWIERRDMEIRRAQEKDIETAAALFEDVHTEEEQGRLTTGWERGVYPTEQTAADAVAKGELFVEEDDGMIVGVCIINQSQGDVYADGKWQYPADPENVMVLHTLAISPHAARKGYGSRFVAFYENYAMEHCCGYLRMDTNERNTTARALYKKLGYAEVDIVQCVFNGIPGVRLVLLEKAL
jgi:ribosomal protein S18 acetylase RimI-like enzyme